MKKIVFGLFFLFITVDCLDAKDYIYINNKFPKSKKKALVILNGVGDSKNIERFN